jgi:hypothetical protein
VNLYLAECPLCREWFGRPTVTERVAKHLASHPLSEWVSAVVELQEDIAHMIEPDHTWM